MKIGKTEKVDILRKELEQLEDARSEEEAIDDDTHETPEKVKQTLRKSTAKEAPEASVAIGQAKPRKPMVKYPRTEAQVKAWEKARQILGENAMKRKQQAEEEAEARRKELEEKIVKKAIAVKKKQIKQEKVLEVSDEEHDPVPIRPKPKPKPVETKPKYTFY